MGLPLFDTVYGDGLPRFKNLWAGIALGMCALCGLFKLSNLLLSNHSLFFQIAPVLFLLPIICAWYTYQTIRKILIAQQNMDNEVIKKNTFRSMRDFMFMVYTSNVGIWLLIIGIQYTTGSK